MGSVNSVVRSLSGLYGMFAAYAMQLLAIIGFPVFLLLAIHRIEKGKPYTFCLIMAAASLLLAILLCLIKIKVL